MEDSRGNKRGRCRSCRCEQFFPIPFDMKCGKCGHPPGLHVIQSSPVKSEANQTIPPGFGPYHHPHYEDYRKCKNCPKPAFYDRELNQTFDYCSPVCRDGDLLRQNKLKTESDIEQLEESIKRMGDLNLPKPTFGHSCYGILTGIKDRIISVTTGDSGNKSSAASTKAHSQDSRRTGTVTTHISSEKQYSDVARMNTKHGHAEGIHTKCEVTKGPSVTVAQNKMVVRVSKDGAEKLGIYLFKSQRFEDYGYTITGYKRHSPISKNINKGEIHLLDVVLECENTALSNHNHVDSLCRDLRNVKLLCSIQEKSHVSSLCRINVPTDTTHIFALKCSEGNQKIGMVMSLNVVKSVEGRSVAEYSGICKWDHILLFAIMKSPNKINSVTSFKDCTPTEFNALLKEAFKAASSTISALLLFIMRT